MDNFKTNFKYYYDSIKNGTYVGAFPNDESIKKIKEIIKKANLKNHLSNEDLHTTLVYSIYRGNPGFVPNHNVEYHASAYEFALFGDQKNTLVILLKSDDLKKRHDQLLENGFRHTHSPYDPHITLCHNFEGDLPDDSLLYENGDKDKPIEFLFTEEYAEPIKIDNN